MLHVVEYGLSLLDRFFESIELYQDTGPNTVETGIFAVVNVDGPIDGGEGLDESLLPTSVPTIIRIKSIG